MGTVPGLLGLVWLRFRPKSGPKSKNSGRILESFVAALWEVILNLLRVGNRSFWWSGRPRGPGDPSKRWGAKPPTFCKGFRGPQGRPGPKNDRSPILHFLKNFGAIQHAATVSGPFFLSRVGWDHSPVSRRPLRRRSWRELGVGHVPGGRWPKSVENIPNFV